MEKIGTKLIYEKIAKYLKCNDNFNNDEIIINKIALYKIKIKTSDIDELNNPNSFKIEETIKTNGTNIYNAIFNVGEKLNNMIKSSEDKNNMEDILHDSRAHKELKKVTTQFINEYCYPYTIDKVEDFIFVDFIRDCFMIYTFDQINRYIFLTIENDIIKDEKIDKWSSNKHYIKYKEHFKMFYNNFKDFIEAHPYKEKDDINYSQYIDMLKYDSDTYTNNKSKEYYFFIKELMLKYVENHMVNHKHSINTSLNHIIGEIYKDDSGTINYRNLFAYNSIMEYSFNTLLDNITSNNRYNKRVMCKYCSNTFEKIGKNKLCEICANDSSVLRFIDNQRK